MEPTFLEFQQNPNSARHAYQACVAAFHAVDRASYPKKPGNLRSKWRKASVAFRVVDMVAHKSKHVVSDGEKEPVDQGNLRLTALVFGKVPLGTDGFNTAILGEGGIEAPSLACAGFLVVDAVPGNWSPATKFAAYTQNNREFLSFWPHSAKCKA